MLHEFYEIDTLCVGRMTDIQSRINLILDMLSCKSEKQV